MDNSISGRPTAYTFDENHPKYRWCCSKSHSKLGIWVVVCAEAVLLFVLLVATVVRMFVPGVNGSSVVGALPVFTFILIAVVVIVALGHGRRTLNAAFIFPHLIVQALLIIGYVVFAFVAFVMMLVNGGVLLSRGDTTERSTGVALIVTGFLTALLLLLIAALHIWFFTIVLACYKYLRDRARHELGLPIKERWGVSSMHDNDTLSSPFSRGTSTRFAFGGLSSSAVPSPTSQAYSTYTDRSYGYRDGSTMPMVKTTYLRDEATSTDEPTHEVTQHPLPPAHHSRAAVRGPTTTEESPMYENPPSAFR